jgi:acetyltransferase-like isoleucine patch superfamily enzyme
MNLLKVDDRETASERVRRKLANNRGRPPSEAVGRALAFAAATLRSRLQLRRVDSMGLGIRIIGHPPLIHNRGTIRLGHDLVLESQTKRSYFNVFPGGELVLGSAVAMNEGCRFDCTSSIRVGDRTRFGYGVAIFDNNFHEVYDRVNRPPGNPVVLEEDVWVGSNAMIFPGVTVGRGAVVAAAAVVRKDVPPFTVVAGNPAQAVKTLDPSKFVEWT